MNMSRQQVEGVLSARDAVEKALEAHATSLRSIQRQLAPGRYRDIVDSALRAAESRHQRLVTVSEMPMRLNEAAEIQQGIAAIEREIAQAPEPLQYAVQHAVQPLRDVLERYGVRADGHVRFREERDLIRASSRSTLNTAPSSLIERARQIFKRVFNGRS